MELSAQRIRIRSGPGPNYHGNSDARLGAPKPTRHACRFSPAAVSELRTSVSSVRTTICRCTNLDPSRVCGPLGGPSIEDGSRFSGVAREDKVQRSCSASGWFAEGAKAWANSMEAEGPRAESRNSFLAEMSGAETTRSRVSNSAHSGVQRPQPAKDRH